MQSAQDLKRGFRLGDFEVRPEDGTMSGVDGTHRVEPRVMDVLVHLASHPGRVVPMQELLDVVWHGRPVVDGAVVRCISLLRKVFGERRGNAKYLETVSKRGYRLVVMPAALEPQIGLPHARMPHRGQPRLAVLPFQNLAADEDTVLSDGVTELLISALARLGGLRVISRTSVMRYRGQDRSMPQIAAALGVDYVIEGSVLRSADRMQIVVQLIDARADEHLWADTIQRGMADLLTVQNEITRSIARQIRTQLAEGDAPHLAAVASIAPAAMQAYLHGLFWLARRTQPYVLRAIEKLHEAARLEPEWERPWAAIAIGQIVRAIYGESPAIDVMAAARLALRELLTRNARSPEAWHIRGTIALFHDWDFDAAEQCLTRAIAEQPSDPIAHLVLGDLHLARRRFDDAIAEIHEAIDLSPLDVGLSMNLGDFLYAAGRLREAAAQLERTLELEPAMVPARVKLSWALAALGEQDLALRQVACLENVGGLAYLDAAVVVNATLGHADRVADHLAALDSLRRARYVSPWTLARCHAIAGRVDAAFEHLEGAFAERTSSLVFILVNPAFERLRSDPRYANLVSRLGFD